MRDDEAIANARAVAAGSLARLAPTYDRSGTFPLKSWSAVRKAGLLPLAITNGHRKGARFETVCRVIEELGSGCVSTALIYTMHATSLLYLGRWADDVVTKAERAQFRALQRRVFSDVLANGAFVANCFGEPGSGPNLESLDTHAEHYGRGWRLNGVKFGTGALYSRWIEMHAAAVVGGERVIMQFVLPRCTPGVRIESASTYQSVRAAAPARLVFTNCLVDERWRFGPPGMFGVAGKRHPYGGVLISAPYVGLARTILAQLATVISARHISGLNRRAVDLSPVRQAFAEAVVAYESASALFHRVIAGETSNPATPELVQIYATKCVVSRMVSAVANAAILIGGTRTLTGSQPFSRHLRDAAAAALHPPTLPQALDVVASLSLDNRLCDTESRR